VNPSQVTQGIVILSIGVPSIFMGAYYRKDAKAQRGKVDKAEDKKKGKKDKKSKRGKKSGKKDKDKDQPGKERGTSGGMSLILGGLFFTALGIARLVQGLIPE
jgi:hypothetical protein